MFVPLFVLCATDAYVMPFGTVEVEMYGTGLTGTLLTVCTDCTGLSRTAGE